MHIKMSSAICLNLDQSKILLSGKGLKNRTQEVNVPEKGGPRQVCHQSSNSVQHHSDF